MEYMNETLKVICERASLRSFAKKEISEDILNQVLQAGVESATGGNLQPYTIIKITDQKILDKLVKAGNQAFIANAPVNLLFCIDWHRTKRICALQKAPFTADQAFPHFWISFQDTIIAAQSVSIAADSVGLGSVYIGTTPQIPESLKVCQEELNLPEGVFPVVLVSMGYPEIKPSYNKKFGQDVLVHENGYKELSNEDLLKAVDEKYGDRTAVKVVKNDKRVEKIIQTTANCMGKSFTKELTAEIEESGVIKIFQHIFGLHYSADVMPTVNEWQMNSIRKSGFKSFDKFTAPE